MGSTEAGASHPVVNDTPCTFRIGDKVVLIWLGPDQPEGVVTRINSSKTYPLLHTVSLTFASGAVLTVGPACLRPASEKASMPLTRRSAQELQPPFLYPAPPRNPIQAPDWKQEDLSESALAEAVTDWERSVGYIEAGFDYTNQIEEYTYDLFNRECIHAFLLGYANQAQPVPGTFAERIAIADRRFIELTAAGDSVYPEWDHDPTAFWYYFRWPISR